MNPGTRRLSRAVIAAAAVTVVVGGAIALITWPLREHLPGTYARNDPSEESIEGRRPYSEAQKELDREVAQCRALAESLLDDVQAGRLERAYEAFGADRGSEKVGREAFVAFVSKHPVLRNPRQFTGSFLVDIQKDPMFCWRTVTDAAKVIELEVQFAHRKDGGLEIAYIRVDKALLSPWRQHDEPQKTK